VVVCDDHTHFVFCWFCMMVLLFFVKQKTAYEMPK